MLCVKCQIEKEETDFYSSELDKNKSRCKACILARNKKYRDENPEKVKATNNKYIKENPEKVKESNKKATAKYRKNNPEKVKETEKRYRENNPEKIAATQKKYKQNNKENINANKRRQYYNNVAYRNHCIISAMVYQMLQLQDSSKAGESCFKYLPWTIKEFIAHIESLFEPWMHWKNQGRYNKKTWKNNDARTHFWQLDHKVPQSDLPYNSMEDENFKKCWSLENLRPLSAKQNHMDGVKRTRHKKKEKIK